jgi:hypothetical protein
MSRIIFHFCAAVPANAMGAHMPLLIALGITGAGYMIL